VGIGPVWDCGRCRLDGPKGLLPLCRVSMIYSGLIGSDGVNCGCAVNGGIGCGCHVGLDGVSCALLWTVICDVGACVEEKVGESHALSGM